MVKNFSDYYTAGICVHRIKNILCQMDITVTLQSKFEF